LGEVPEGWGVSAIKRLATFIYGDALPIEVRNTDGNVPVFGSNGSFGIHDQPNTRAPVILIGRKGSCGALNWSNVPVFAIDTVYFVDDRTCSANLHWFFWSLHIANLEAASQDTGVPGLSREFAHSTMLPVPPEEEQQAIASFLDAETSRMDTLITEYKTLIDLLKEKRQALISQAVTKGLNPDVPMKDSGVEWLGDVPEHWSVRRLRFIANLNPSKSECSNIGEDEEVSFLPMEAIGDDGSLNLEHVKPINEVNSGYTYFRNGDVTIAKITPCFENGKGAVMSGLKGHIGFGTTELIVVRPEQNISISEYIHLIFVSAYFRKLGESWMYGAGGQKRVPDEFVRNFKIRVPPIDEQRTIAAFLDTEIARIDALVQDAGNGINLLRERRMTLISDAVTGKIDVRDWKKTM
ncbi:restriction endonuclease subunit S, partial [Acidithiobacillus ferridurans]|uniref:restriction endonuclease subunit S n=1 Tax=Acidithiobacillus ferridurans TaxID=1232575 RepID=UPI001C074C26